MFKDSLALDDLSNLEISTPRLMSERARDFSNPVLILGGRENALSITRNLGRSGIDVRVSGPIDCWGMNSTHCREAFRIPRNKSHWEFWAELLLGNSEQRLHGSVLICCSDMALEFVAENHAELRERFLLPEFHPELTLALLDKKKTIQLAQEIGVPAPGYWTVDNENDLERLAEEISFPAMVKPIHSHLFIPVMGQKLFIFENDMDALADNVRECWKHGLEIMVVEMIPGPDSELSSYYTYLDQDGKSHFEYTKRIIRRFPENRGLACHHESKWLPQTAAAGEAFFRGIGFYGLGNIEFKHDYRDGQLKVIESNTRFTAAQELILQCGAPIDMIYYCLATNQPAPVFSRYEENLRYWYGLRDALSFLELHRAGKITTMEWLRSISPSRTISPLHDRNDLWPSLGAVKARLGRSFGKG